MILVLIGLGLLMLPMATLLTWIWIRDSRRPRPMLVSGACIVAAMVAMVALLVYSSPNTPAATKGSTNFIFLLVITLSIIGALMPSHRLGAAAIISAAVLAFTLGTLGIMTIGILPLLASALLTGAATEALRGTIGRLQALMTGASAALATLLLTAALALPTVLNQP